MRMRKAVTGDLESARPLLFMRVMRAFVIAFSLLVVAVLVGCSSEADGGAGVPSHGLSSADLPNEESDDDVRSEQRQSQVSGPRARDSAPF